MLNHDTREVASKIAPGGASGEERRVFSHNRLCDSIYAVIFLYDAKYAQRSVVLWISHLRKYFRRIVDFSTRVPRSFIPARFTERGKGKNGEKTRQMENRTRRVPEDFAFIARKYFFAGDGRRTHTRRAVYSVDDPLRARSYSDGAKIGLD